MDFEKEINHFAKQVEPSGFEISEAAQSVAVQALEEVDSRYGENSAKPLEYHNAPHAIDVIRRGIRLSQVLMPYIPGQHRKSMFDLATIGGAIHDFERGIGDGFNEKLSAEYGVQLIHSYGYSREINTKKFIRRLRDGVHATQVKREENGKIIQVNLRQGAHDPFKFILATADINGIAMEGPKRMVRDAVNLCYEMHDGNPTADQLHEFIAFQPKFLKDRLNDEDQIKPDIEHYFPKESEDVYRVLEKEFGGTIKFAYGKALDLARLPVVHRTINEKLRVTSHIPGHKFVQDTLADAINL